LRYYLRHKDSDEIKGPMDLDQINDLISNSELNEDYFATFDIGEPYSAILKTPKRDWFPLAKVAGIQGLSSPNQKQKPLNNSDLFRMIILWTIAGVVLYLAYKALRFVWGGLLISR